VLKRSFVFIESKKKDIENVED